MEQEDSASSREIDSRITWRSRGYIPHYDAPGLFQLITFRLHDSLPAVKLAELNRIQYRLTATQIRNTIEEYLDAGAGACYLRDPRVAELAQETLLFFDTERYHLCAWVVMPNHIHVLAQHLPEYPVAKVVHSWKRFIARQGNLLLGRSGEFWQREYFDRYIRNETHFRNAVKYIEWNPVKAMLAEDPAAWTYSSARFHRRDFG